MKKFDESSKVVSLEVSYIADKIMQAKNKKKDTCSHWAALYGATLDEFKKNGVKYEPIGNHSYKFKVPSKNSKAYDWLKLIVGDKNVDETFTKDEVKYLLEKIKNAAAKTDKKPSRVGNKKVGTAYYGYLNKSTLGEFDKLGIEYEKRGSHGYFFVTPTEKKVWGRIRMYGLERDKNGHFISKKKAAVPTPKETVAKADTNNAATA